MLFLPIENLTITTSLTPDQVRQRLSNIVEPTQMFSILSQKLTKPYRGTIDYDQFKIFRTINYRNSFLPIITGRISPQLMGCEIKIHMRLHLAVLVFMIYWLGMTGGLGFSWLLNMLVTQEFCPPCLVPLGMFVFGCLLCTIPFKIEAHHSKQFLENLFRPSSTEASD